MRGAKSSYIRPLASRVSGAMLSWRVTSTQYEHPQVMAPRQIPPVPACISREAAMASGRRGAGRAIFGDEKRVGLSRPGRFATVPETMVTSKLHDVDPSKT